MRKVFLLVMLAFLLSSVNSAAAALRHDGFMGIKWGTDIRRFPGVDWSGWDYEWKLHVEMPLERLKSLFKTNDVKKLDEFPVALIMYHFLDLRFSGVDIVFADDAWIEAQAYIDYFKENLGEHTHYDELSDTVFWLFDDGFAAILRFKSPIPVKNASMMLTLLSPQEARHKGYSK